MGRILVEHNGKYAEFSTIVDNFIVPFMDKEEYESWAKTEYGRLNYKPVEIRRKMKFVDAVNFICMNRTKEESVQCLCKIGLEETEARKLVTERIK